MLSFIFGAMGGILAVLAFPPFNYTYLIWLFPLPFYYVASKGKSVALALAGWSAVFFGYELHFFPQNAFLALFGASFLQFVILGIVLDLLLKAKASPPFLLLFPTLWVSLELVEDKGFLGIPFSALKFFSTPWLSIGTSLYSHSLSLIASCLGVWGLSFLILLIGGLIYRFISTKRIVMLSLLLSFLFSSSFFPQGSYQKGADLKVGLIQPCVSVEAVELPTAGVSRDIRLSALLFFQRNLDLIVWPVSYAEGGAIPSGSIAQYMSTFAKEYHCYLVVGVDGTAKKVLFYSLEGNILGSFNKEYLTPFVDWFPHAVKSSSKRRGSRLMKADRFSFSVFLGTEVGHSLVIRKSVNAGSGFILVISDEPGAQLLLANATLRAIETGSYLVFSDNFGPSSLISPNGGRKEIPPSVASTLFGGISSRPKGSLFLLVGPYWIFILLILLFVDYLLKLRYSRFNSS